MSDPKQLVTGHAAMHHVPMLPTQPDCGSPCAMCESYAHLLAKAREDAARLRDSHAAIYLALGTNEADHTKWPQHIAALREEVARLSQRILDDNKAYGCELRDPSGTIWEHAAKLEAEVARLQMQVDSMCDAEQLQQEREARKKAEAEVARLHAEKKELAETVVELREHEAEVGRLREEVKHSHNDIADLLIVAKAWALVWADKLSAKSLAQFEALEKRILERAALAGGAK